MLVHRRHLCEAHSRARTSWLMGGAGGGVVNFGTLDGKVRRRPVPPALVGRVCRVTKRKRAKSEIVKETLG